MATELTTSGFELEEGQRGYGVLMRGHEVSYLKYEWIPFPMYIWLNQGVGYYNIAATSNRVLVCYRTTVFHCNIKHNYNVPCVTLFLREKGF